MAINNPRSDAAKLAHMVRRIVAVWEQCTEDDEMNGREWYDRAAQASWDMQSGDVVRAAGVIAALSPRCAWSTNVRWARMMLTAATEGAPCPPVHTTTMRAQAWRIANGEHPLSVLNGPKVRAFYANITGDEDVVTVDVWAARIAEGWKAPQPDAESRITRNRRKTGTGSIATTGAYKTEPSPSGKRYRTIAEAYRQAAAKISAGTHISPRDLQAAVWTHVRGSHS